MMHACMICVTFFIFYYDIYFITFVRTKVLIIIIITCVA